MLSSAASPVSVTRVLRSSTKRDQWAKRDALLFTYRQPSQGRKPRDSK